jgi:hypothetical protein
VVVESGSNTAVEETSPEEEESGIRKEGEGISPAAAVNDSNTVVVEIQPEVVEIYIHKEVEEI